MTESVLGENRLGREAFEEFYRRISPKLWHYIRGVCGNAALADDLFQETFLRYLKTVRLDLHERQQCAFLFKIAARLIIDNMRKINPVSLDDRGETISRGDGKDGPNKSLETDMINAFAVLKPSDRSLLWLAYIEGYSHKEIADIMGLKAKSVRVLLFRLRTSFAELLRARGYTGEEVA